MKLEHIKNLIQSCNINFLIGSGLSTPYLATLGNIEMLLTTLEEKKSVKNKYNLIKASLYKKYFEDVILRNLDSEIEKYHGEKQDESGDTKTEYQKYTDVLESHKNLLLNLNEVLLRRENNLLTKQINLFTTNIDLFLETALEEAGLEFNDGFKGRKVPVYDLSNFNKSYLKTSSHYDNISEIPVFNLFKVHGSISWEKRDANQISHTNELKQVIKIQEALRKINSSKTFLKISDESTYEKLFEEAEKKIQKTEKAQNTKHGDKLEYENFFKEYDKLLIVNPTKEKFERTVFDDEFYELLRIYANALEKENTLLFVMGFSFADSHIKKITIRVANSNPTLQIIVFAYSEDDLEKLSNELSNIKNNNIKILSPKLFFDANTEKDDKNEKEEQPLEERLKYFNCKSVNQEIFDKIKDMVSLRNMK